MSNPQSPQITVVEGQSQVVPISPAAADIVAFVGECSRGPINTVTYITSETQYRRIFGGPWTGSQMWESVRAFFQNGGTRCYIVRVGHYTDITDAGTLDAVAATVTLQNSTPTNSLKVSMSWAGALGNNYSVTCARRDTNVGTTTASTGTSPITSIQVTAATARRLYIGAQVKVNETTHTIRFIVTGISGTTVTFASLTPAASVVTPATVTVEEEDLTLYYNGTAIATYQALAMNSTAGSRYVEALNNLLDPEVQFVFDELGVAASATVDPRPADQSSPVALASGSDGSAVTAADVVGSSSSKVGLYALDGTEINFMGTPGLTSATVMVGLQTYLALRPTVFGIISPPQASTPTSVVTWLETTVNVASDHLGVFWPWLKVDNARTGYGTVTVSPEGHVAGVFARVVREYKLSHSPAGQLAGRLQGVLDLERRILLGSADYDAVYPHKINAIVPMDGGGVAIMGDKTLGIGTELGYINKRRVQDNCITSIRKDTLWVLFENNDTASRAQWTRTVEAFLLTQWREGNLDGEKASDAFYVICNKDNNPESVIRAKKFVGRIGLHHKNSIGFAEYTFEEDLRQAIAELTAAGL